MSSVIAGVHCLWI